MTQSSRAPRRRQPYRMRPQSQPAVAARKQTPPEVSAARVAAIAGIAGALIGAAATGIPVLAAAQWQFESQFLMPQRQTAYLQFMADEGALLEAEVRDLGAADEGQSQEQKRDELRMLLDKMYKSEVNVGIFGSREAAGVAFELTDMHYKYVLDFADGNQEQNVTAGDHDPARRLKDIVDREATFRNIAHEDLTG